jgi:peptidoglycan/LPS O-acetylase OafA/YrhL
VNNSKNYYLQLDGLRFFAALFVALSHWLNFTGSGVFGRFGVDLFFTISGFLITTVLLKTKKEIDEKRISLARGFKIFYICRSLRIFPLYYLLILILIFFHFSHIKNSIWWNLTFMSNFYNIKINEWVGHTTNLWTLAVEEQFYLLWAIIMLLFPSRLHFSTTILFIFSAPILRGLFYFQDMNYFYTYLFTPACFDTLGLGSLLALLRFSNFEFYRKWTNNGIFALFSFVFILFTGYFMVFYWHSFPHFVLMRLSFGIFSFIIIDKCLEGFKGNLGKILSHKWITYCGRISYGLYLFHTLINGMFLGMKYPENQFLRFPIYLLAIIGIASLTYYWIEKPINDFKYRYFKI